MNSFGYSRPEFDAPRNQPELAGKAREYFDRLSRQRLIIRNDQCTVVLSLPFMRATLLGLVLFPLSALVIGGVWVGILKLEFSSKEAPR